VVAGGGFPGGGFEQEAGDGPGGGVDAEWTRNAVGVGSGHALFGGVVVLGYGVWTEPRGANGVFIAGSILGAACGSGGHVVGRTIKSMEHAGGVCFWDTKGDDCGDDDGDDAHDFFFPAAARTIRCVGMESVMKTTQIIKKVDFSESAKWHGVYLSCSRTRGTRLYCRTTLNHTLY
jgi:hypothetical protein